MRRSTLRACSSCWARASRRAKTSRERMGSCGDRGLAIADCGLGAGKSAIRNRQSAITAAPAARNSRRSIVLAPPGGGAYIMAPPVPQEGDVRMSFETRIEPLDGKLPKVSYRWDPETDILSVACKGVAKATGFDGTVDLEGDDGSFVLLDVVGGVLRGVEVVSWPDDVRTLDALAVPEPTKDGRVVFASRKSQPEVAAVEVDTALTVEKNHTESVLHVRVGRMRIATVVRIADHVLVELDKQSRLAGLWFLEVPPFPNVEVTA